MKKLLCFSVILILLVALPVLAGGPPTDRPLDFLGKISPQVDFDSVSYNDGVFLALVDGK
ncbi:TPA: hypothetical protein DD449_01580 [Candidatus Berkelbacteria bacterium]|uniref:Uncharacterized protein n=1 Tax=Berkelbacteria bacterium GW2011_GWE1_39_12 TaxID=1618337 RepID=A0A0G4B4K9_9BACT|nr:MAG: hypothetical protein UT28_C0001G0770 [Berkelbacteria bacterium GW2011_GWE1_39_12]HBO60361.1 hypothetical protein [Candidatus Berkelbacteria bacterium]